MPVDPPAVFVPPSAGSAPSAPGGVFTPPSAGSPPSAPGGVFTPPSAGSPPSAPGGVFTPPSAGSAPEEPGGVFTPPSAESAPAEPGGIFSPPTKSDGYLYLTTSLGGNRDITYTLPEAEGPLSIRYIRTAGNFPYSGAVTLVAGVLTYYLPMSGAPGSAVPTLTADSIMAISLAALRPYFGVRLVRARAVGSDGSGIINASMAAIPMLPRPLAPPPAIFTP